MAHGTPLDRKAQLVAELQRSRVRMSGNVEGLRHDVNLPEHFRTSVQRHKSIWLALAALFGWVLARLPARRKKVKVLVDRKDQQEIKRLKSAGIVVGIFRLLWPLAKPLITAYITKKMTSQELKDEGMVTKRPQAR